MAMTPTARSAGVSADSRMNAPRSLKAPIACMFSYLTKTLAPVRAESRGAGRHGVFVTTPSSAVAAASAELGVLFTALTLALGSLWGRPVWGVWWTWDARLITTTVLLFLYVGYLAIRRIPASDEVRGRRNAIAALVAFVDVPVVHFSVVWWRTLHQQATVVTPELDPQIEGAMAAALLVGVVAFTALFVRLLWARYELAAHVDHLEADVVADAVRRRRATATDAVLQEVSA